MEIKKIATVYTDFSGKFGIPRQSGLAPDLAGRIVMEKEFSGEEFFRGIEGWSHIWVIWGFSENEGEWHPTVRPPRLGGNRRVGVFASRSPFRPNNLALTLVRLNSISFEDEQGTVLHVSGIDMKNGTPVYDIKPYIPGFESIEDAGSGFVESADWEPLEVKASPELLSRIPEEKRAGLIQALAQDPRPQYQDDPDRIYGFGFADREIKFRVSGNTLILVDILDKI